jgi:hypothetical protein
MRVRTIRTHTHAGIQRHGSAGSVYEVDDAVGKNLIASGYVVDADAPVDEEPAKKPANGQKKAG